MTHFTVDLLPAGNGDALLVQWGADERHGHRMLIDAGHGGAHLNYALAAAFSRLDKRDRHVDVVVSTHMDADHIAGLLGLFGEPPDGFSVGEIWFNAFRHLPQDDVLGWKQSDRLEELVQKWVADHKDAAWNDSLGRGGAIVVPEAPDDQHPARLLPSVTIGGMTITLVSPTMDRLHAVARRWPAAVRKARLDLTSTGDLPAGSTTQEENDVLGFDEDKGVEPSVLARRGYQPDRTPPNGASIAIIAEFAQRRVLLAADAHAEVLEGTLRRFQPEGQITFNAVKLSHHGSEKNLSPDLLAMLDCPAWLVSSSGGGFNHPDRRAIARLITRRRPTHLVFNYRSGQTVEWARASRQQEYGFTAYLPPDGGSPGVRHDVMTGTAVPLP
jgi:beta-lactamase superfamily II metal-dependent hydrolase